MRRSPGLWILVAACVALSVGYGVRQCLGLFIGPMSADRGWTTGVFAFAFALQNLTWGVAQPFVGAFADRFGSRITVAAGGAAFASSIAFMATTRDPWLFAWIGGIGLGVALAATSFAVLIGPAAAVAAPERRAVALGILGAGGSLGQTFYPLFAQPAIAAFGWHVALVTLAAIGLGIVPLALVLKGKRPVAAPSDLGVGGALREALGAPSYVLLSIGFFVCGFHIAFFQTHLPNIVARAGFSPQVGATALAIVGIFNVLGSYGAGRLSQRFPRRYVLASIYALRSVAILLFVLVPISPLSIVVFSATLGVLWLSTVPPTSEIIAGKFGLRWVSTLFGVSFFSHQVGAFCGAWLGAVVLERTGSYDLMWVIAIALGIGAALIHLPIDERPVARVAAGVAA